MQMKCYSPNLKLQTCAYQNNQRQWLFKRTENEVMFIWIGADHEVIECEQRFALAFFLLLHSFVVEIMHVLFRIEIAMRFSPLAFSKFRQCVECVCCVLFVSSISYIKVHSHCLKHTHKFKRSNRYREWTTNLLTTSNKK